MSGEKKKPTHQLPVTRAGDCKFRPNKKMPALSSNSAVAHNAQEGNGQEGFKKHFRKAIATMITTSDLRTEIKKYFFKRVTLQMLLENYFSYHSISTLACLILTFSPSHLPV